MHTDAEVSLAQAILGGTIRIQGVYETQTIQVHFNTLISFDLDRNFNGIHSIIFCCRILQVLPGTSSHTKICLSNKGMKRVNSYGNGDHYVHIKIAIPKSLTNEQRALIQVSSLFIDLHQRQKISSKKKDSKMVIN